MVPLSHAGKRQQVTANAWLCVTISNTITSSWFYISSIVIKGIASSSRTSSYPIRMNLVRKLNIKPTYI
jgi:hypothetical protein